MLSTEPKALHPKLNWLDLLKQTWPQYISQFAEMTTLHGVRYLGERNRSLLERVFWGLAMIVTYSFCWYFVAQVSSDWRTSPVVMSVETRATSSWSVPSPALSVCTSSHISHSKINVAAMKERKNLSDKMRSRLNVVYSLCGDINNDAETLDDDALTYVIKNYLPDLQRVFLTVSRMNEVMEPLSDHIQTVITPSSICFVHNMLPLSSLLRPEFLNVYEHYGLSDNESASQFQTLWTPELGYQTNEAKVMPMRLWGDELRTSTKYLLGMSDLDYDSVCSFGSKALSVYLHNPAEIPWRVHSNVYLKPNYRVTVFITPIVTSTDDIVKVWNTAKRGCYFEKERYLRYFRIYTQRNCERECDSNNTFSFCGCVLASHPRNLTMPICGPKKTGCVEKSQQEMIENEMRTKETDLRCQCLPSCNEIDFVAEVHWRPWQFNVNSTYAAIPTTVDKNSTSVSLLGVAVKKKYLNKTKRTALMGYAGYVEEMIENEMRTKETDLRCQCLPSCNEIDFVAEVHWRPWQFNVNSTYAAIPTTVDKNSTSVSLLGVAVKKKYLNKTKRTALMGYAGYVASIGGILSLFLGISFLSLFEVVYFATLRVLTNIWNMKRRQNQHEERFWAIPIGNNQQFIL